MPTDDAGLTTTSLQSIAARAATIRERIATRGEPAPAAVVTACLDERAMRALRAWCNACALGDSEAFARRLGWEGLSVDAALVAVGPVDAEAPTFDAEWTPWLLRFVKAAAHGPMERQIHARTLLRSHALPFDELLAPIVVATAAEWEGRCGPVAATVLEDAARQDVFARLGWECSFVAERATDEAFRAFRTAASAEREGYAAFVADPAARLAQLFDTYPVMARQLAGVAACWVEASGELVERLAADRALIARMFNGGRDPGRVASIAPALSDPHDGRRRVAGITFEDGLRVVYKPRGLSLDAAFQSLLAWLTARGLRPCPRTLVVADRGSYGWVEHVRREELDDAAAVNRYYERAGALLALAWLLGGRDLHAENVIATREGPVLVDLEVLLQPSRSAGRTDRTSATRDAGEADESVLSTGMLRYIETAEDGTAFDLGGLQGDSGHLPIRTRRWQGLGSDAVRAEEIGDVRQAPNAVTAGGALQHPRGSSGALLRGFDRTCAVVRQHRDDLLAAGGPLDAFAACATRFLSRPTEQYGRLIALITGPRYQRDGAAASWALDVLLRPYARSPVKPGAWPLLLAERDAIAALDVPRFEVPGGGGSVSAAGRVVLDRPDAVPGVAAVRARVDALTEERQRAQAALIAGALPESPATRYRETLAVPAHVEPGERGEWLRRAASWIGRELLRHADAGALPTRAGSGDALYDGQSGCVVFLAALAAATGEPVWRDAALAAAERVVRCSQEPVADGEPIGACSGRPSVAYALAVASRLLADEALQAAAVAAMDVLPVARIDEDVRFDLCNGAAGALLVSLALHQSTGDARWLERAVRCGERLLGAARESAGAMAWPSQDGQFYTGLAHGSAGIGYALLRLHVATGESRWRRAWAATVAHEAQAYAGGNWALTVSPGAPAAAMVAWCHGAAGIALARVYAARHTGDATVFAELGDALALLGRLPPARAEHVCCGTLGRAATLFSAGTDLGLEPMCDAALDIAIGVVRRAARQGHVRLSATPYEYRVVDAGFFQGLSGIGYEMLRLGGASLPCVLSFEAPTRSPSIADA